LGLNEILSANDAKEATTTQISLVKSISRHVNTIKSLIDKMETERSKIQKLDLEKQAEAYCHKIKPMMDEIRDNADALEMMVDDELWPIPKMREILFTR
jgi:glutamine synthetase